MLAGTLMSSYAQEMWGVVGGNYAGINGALLNPSSILHSKLYLDINIAAADVFLENNAFYIHREDYHPISFLKSSDNLPAYGKDDLPFDYYSNKQRKNIHLSGNIRGPSLSVVRGYQAFGFVSGFRTVFSGRDIPYEVIPLSYEGLNYEPLQNINFNDDQMLITGMAWFEMGLTYARSIIKQGRNQLSAGVTAKFLLGYAGAYLDIENIDYIVNNDSTLNIRNVRGELGFSSSSLPGDRFFSGKGLSVDLGITYVKKKRGYSNWSGNKLCRQQAEDYYYKLGVSLLDLGWMHFSNGAQGHDYNDVGRFWENVDTVNFRNLDYFTQLLSNEFYGDPNASLSADRIKILLPSALSVQFDYHINQQWYVHGVVVQALKTGKSYLYRPAQLAVIPRYETKYLEFSVPITLYDYRYPRFGLSARFWFLTIGTDNMLGFLNLTDFTGMDLYFSLKFNFLKGKCRSTNYHCESRGGSFR